MAVGNILTTEIKTFFMMQPGISVNWGSGSFACFGGPKVRHDRKVYFCLRSTESESYPSRYSQNKFTNTEIIIAEVKSFVRVRRHSWCLGCIIPFSFHEHSQTCPIVILPCKLGHQVSETLGHLPKITQLEKCKAVF